MTAKVIKSFYEFKRLFVSKKFSIDIFILNVKGREETQWFRAE